MTEAPQDEGRIATGRAQRDAKLLAGELREVAPNEEMEVNQGISLEIEKNHQIQDAPKEKMVLKIARENQGM